MEALSEAAGGYNFQWCCRPVVRFMQFTGIPLLEWPAKGRYRRPLFVLVCSMAIVFYVMHFASSVINTMIMINFPVESRRNLTDSVTSMWNVYINFFSFTLCTILTHTSLLFITAVKWNGLTAALRQLERLPRFKPEDYKRFRKTCLIGLVCLVLVIQSSGVGRSHERLWSSWIILQEMVIQCIDQVHYLVVRGNLSEKIQITASVVAHSYPYTCIILFCSYGRLICHLLHHLRKQMTSQRPVGRAIDEWKRFYFLIDQVVDHLNASFGFVLLILIASIFIRTTSTSFFALFDLHLRSRSFQEEVALMLLVLKDLAYLTALTFTANGIHREVLEL